MSRDQKPGRANVVAGAQDRAASATAAGASAVAVNAAATPGGNAVVPAVSAAGPPVMLLASLFIVASSAGGIGYALLIWLVP